MLVSIFFNFELSQAACLYAKSNHALTPTPY